MRAKQLEDAGVVGVDDHLVQDEARPAIRRRLTCCSSMRQREVVGVPLDGCFCCSAPGCCCTSAWSPAPQNIYNECTQKKGADPRAIHLSKKKKRWPGLTVTSRGDDEQALQASFGCGSSRFAVKHIEECLHLLRVFHLKGHGVTFSWGTDCAGESDGTIVTF